MVTADARAGAWPDTAGFARGAAVPAPRTHEAGALAFTRAALQELLWEDAGLLRDADGLTHAASVIAGWRARAADAPAANRGTGEDRAGDEDQNLLLVAAGLVAAALARRTSIGAHARRDSVVDAPSEATAEPALEGAAC